MKSKPGKAFYVTDKQCNSMSVIAENLDKLAGNFAGLVPGHEEILGEIAGNLHVAAQTMRDIKSAVVSNQSITNLLEQLGYDRFFLMAARPSDQPGISDGITRMSSNQEDVCWMISEHLRELPYLAKFLQIAIWQSQGRCTDCGHELDETGRHVH